MREVFEETHITAEVKRMVGIRCDRKTWYLSCIKNNSNSCHQKKDMVK